MKRGSYVAHCLIWLFTICLLLSGNVFSAGLIFKDGQYSFQTLRALGYAVSGGADIGEMLNTVYAVKEGDDESWYREWLKTAEQREKAGDEFLARGKIISARQEFFKASNYYRTSEFFLHTMPDDPRIVSVWKKSRDSFLKGAKLADHPIVPVSIPFEGDTLPGYLCLVDASGARRPLLIVQTGFDGTKEELYFATAYFAVKRGYNVLLFEGPGQGEMIRIQKLPFRPNWETVITPVVDYAMSLKEVDAKRIALMGISFGGYLAPRAVAFEKRIKACIANGGVYDFHMTAHLTPDLEKYLDTREGAEEIDKDIYARMKTDPSFRWVMANGMFTFHAGSPSAWLKMTRPYTMKDVAAKIACPILIVDSEGDKDMPGQAKRLYDALTSPRKDFMLFTKEEGAEEHCQMGAILISNARILDWLDDIMARDNVR
ncbi:MAG TPA: prolyl oligopeptidase family serine peptidase [Syntrophorhabdaceae bacterium]|nr:prolyl oligopeptidase family serine peptidase [Syntrophorhabdaceae bacterium]HQM81004.1 prolyl oligopeptidase family serine peptidase [Syntrophorhabdaceae bacterium]